MSRSRILVRNTSWNFASQGWLIALGFVITPYIIRKLGADAYGVLSIIGVVIGYFGFLDLGLGQAVIKYVSEYYAKKEFDLIGQVISTAIALYLILGTIGAAIIALLSEWLVRSILKIPTDLMDISLFAFYVSALGFLINMPLTVFGSIPGALQRFDITNKIGIGVGTLQLSLTVLLLHSGYFLKAIVIMTIFISILSILLYANVLKRLLPKIKIRPAFSRRILNDMFRFGGFMLIARVAGTVVFQTDRIIIGIFFPISYVTYYSVPHSLAKKLLIVPTSIGTAAFPAASELSSLNLQEELRELYLRTTKFLVLLALPLVATFIVLGDKLLAYWLDPEFSLRSATALQILSCAIFVMLLTQPSTDISRGTGRPEWLAISAGSNAIMNVVLCMLLVPRLGINGAATSLLISTICATIPFIHVVNRKAVKVSMKELLAKSFLKPMIVGVLVFALLSLLRPLVTNLAGVLSVATFTYAGGVLVSYFVVLDKKEKKAVILWLESIKKKNVREKGPIPASNEEV